MDKKKDKTISEKVKDTHKENDHSIESEVILMNPVFKFTLVGATWYSLSDISQKKETRQGNQTSWNRRGICTRKRRRSQVTFLFDIFDDVYFAAISVLLNQQANQKALFIPKKEFLKMPLSGN
jgi:hypothetical protein